MNFINLRVSLYSFIISFQRFIYLKNIWIINLFGNFNMQNVNNSYFTKIKQINNFIFKIKYSFNLIRIY